MNGLQSSVHVARVCCHSATCSNARLMNGLCHPASASHHSPIWVISRCEYSYHQMGTLMSPIPAANCNHIPWCRNPDRHPHGSRTMLLLTGDPHGIQRVRSFCQISGSHPDANIASRTSSIINMLMVYAVNTGLVTS